MIRNELIVTFSALNLISISFLSVIVFELNTVFTMSASKGLLFVLICKCVNIVNIFQKLRNFIPNFKSFVIFISKFVVYCIKGMISTKTVFVKIARFFAHIPRPFLHLLAR